MKVKECSNCRVTGAAKNHRRAGHALSCWNADNPLIEDAMLKNIWEFLRDEKNQNSSTAIPITSQIAL